MSYLHDKYVVVPADKVTNNIVFVRKSHYIDCLIKELGIYNSLGNHRCTPTTPNPGQSTNDDKLDLPTLYRIPKVHKCPYRHCYIAGCAKCSMKHEKQSFTVIMTLAIKKGV